MGYCITRRLYQRASAPQLLTSLLPGAAGASGRRYWTSRPARIAAAVWSVAFLAVTFLRQQGRLAQLDLRIIIHVVPGRYHPRLLAAMHPLLHLGDAVFLIPVSLVAIAVLWLRGYRRTWVLLVSVASWPLELLCKTALDQPGALSPSGRSDWVAASVQLRSLVSGTSTEKVLAWLDRAMPGFSMLMQHAGSAVVGLSSSFPSGTAARGTFALGLLAWLCLLAGIPLLSELLALSLLGAIALLGFALVLFAWHLPSDVLGGSVLGFALLSVALALLRRPADEIDASPAGARLPH
jgi:membrane-associated phospholipid phosphatase